MGGLTLFGTHESTLVDAGSATLKSERAKSDADFEETLVATNEVGEDGIAATEEDVGDDRTETVWSPASERAGYVRMAFGFEERYRIDNEAPGPNEILELRRFEGLLAGAAWSGATGVVATDDGYAVTYESDGVADEERLKRVLFGDRITEFEATIAVSESGYVTEIAYDITVERGDRWRREDVTMSVGRVGETTVDEPEWAGTAREEGLRFEVAPTDDGSAVEVALVNGTEVPGGARVSLADARGRGETELSDAMTTGDRLYLALSDDGALLQGTDGSPDNVRALESFYRATIRNQGFMLYFSESRL